MPLSTMPAPAPTAISAKVIVRDTSGPVSVMVADRSGASVFSFTKSENSHLQMLAPQIVRESKKLCKSERSGDCRAGKFEARFWHKAAELKKDGDDPVAHFTDMLAKLKAQNNSLADDNAIPVEDHTAEKRRKNRGWNNWK